MKTLAALLITASFAFTAFGQDIPRTFEVHRKHLKQKDINALNERYIQIIIRDIGGRLDRLERSIYVPSGPDYSPQPAVLPMPFRAGLALATETSYYHPRIVKVQSVTLTHAGTLRGPLIPAAGVKRANCDDRMQDCWMEVYDGVNWVKSDHAWGLIKKSLEEDLSARDHEIEMQNLIISSQEHVIGEKDDMLRNLQESMDSEIKRVRREAHNALIMACSAVPPDKRREVCSEIGY